MLDFIVTRKRAEPKTLAINTDYTCEFESGMFDTLNVKLSGTYTASGTGPNALDGPFGFLGKTDFVRGSDTLIIAHGTDLRHIGGFLCGAHPEILPASIAASGTYLGQVQIPLRNLMPQAAIDGRGQQLVARGRTRGLTNLGAAVLTIATGKLRFGGETCAVPNGDHFEPQWLAQTIDISTASSDLKGKYTVGTDFTAIPALYFRQHDASAEAGDPNAARTDGLVRSVRIEANMGGTVKQLGTWTWGEIKQDSTSKWKISGATGQIQTGVGMIQLRDPERPETNEAPVFMAGDTITVFVDTASAIEDEFTAVSPSSSDTFFWYPLGFIMRGPSADAARALAARDRDRQKRISEARSVAMGLVG